MRPYIGEDVKTSTNKVVHVQDLDLIRMEALVGSPDENRIVWDRVWVSWEYIQPLDPP